MTPVRLEPAALRSRVKHSTTEPLRSLLQLTAKRNTVEICKKCIFSVNPEIWGCLKSYQLFTWASKLSFVFKYKLQKSWRIILARQHFFKKWWKWHFKPKTTFLECVNLLNLISLDTNISHIMGHFGTNTCMSSSIIFNWRQFYNVVIKHENILVTFRGLLWAPSPTYLPNTLPTYFQVPRL